MWRLLAIILFALTAQAQSPRSTQKIGIIYELWHCGVSESKKFGADVIPDISRALKGLAPWGGVPGFHWWGRPDAGYYCLADNDALLAQHAKQLAAAHIDFVVIDNSNWESSKGPQTANMIIKPFDRLMSVWSKIPNAPKVVVWTPMVSGGDMADYFDGQMQKYSQLQLSYQGHPLMLVVDNGSHPVDRAVENRFRARYTLRHMWGLLPDAATKAGVWSFMQPCRAGFRESAGSASCAQSSAMSGGRVEEVSVTSAYQETYMSETRTAVPKFKGRTLLRQLQTAWKNPQAPFVIISTWNEWIAQRQGGKTSTGNEVFVDLYDAEYSRDLEPGGGMGSYYYDLLSRALGLLKAGRDPMGAL